MHLYQNFLGIDIGKFTFVVACLGQKTTHEYENSTAGIAQFISEHGSQIANSLSVLETTGGYELDLLYTFSDLGYAVHRADTRKVKSFIRSYGSSAKTDKLDAKALALYGKERTEKLDLFKPQCKEDIRLFQLVQRRNDIKSMVVAEKNRLQSPSIGHVKSSVQKVLAVLNEELAYITNEIQLKIDFNPDYKRKQLLLKSIPGIGSIVSFELLILLPELGTLSRRKIASLAGLAPRSNESGIFKGYRSTSQGRQGIKPILFLAAMSARNSHSPLKAFYEKLIGKGKKKMVALTALMRKILVIANAKIKSEFIQTT